MAILSNPFNGYFQWVLLHFVEKKCLEVNFASSSYSHFSRINILLSAHRLQQGITAESISCSPLHVPLTCHCTSRRSFQCSEEARFASVDLIGDTLAISKGFRIYLDSYHHPLGLMSPINFQILIEDWKVSRYLPINLSK